MNDDYDPYRMPRVTIVNKPKNPPGPDAPGFAVPGWRTKVYVDGVDMSRAVYSVQVNAEKKDALRATIEVAVSEIEFDGPVLEVGPESHALLTRLGWTPPAYESAGEGAAV